MNAKQREKVIKEFFERACLPKLESKGRDYTDALRGASANNNFQFVAELLSNKEVDKYTIWFVYFSKHLTSLMRWITQRKLESEPIEERIADMVNYLLILYSMTKEDEE